MFQPIGVVIRQIDTGDLAAVEAAITPKTRLVWIESPTNPRLLITDIAAVSKLAHARSALVVVDNTFATPVFQQPFELGADIVVHSVTKYLAGHSDMIQGAVLAKDAAVFEPMKFLQNATGAVPSPFDCWLTMRGLKTLELRMQRHEENAVAIAKALSGQPLVRRVYFPGLLDHPGHEIARKQMTGFGGMVSFELDGSMDEVVAFASSRRYFALAESLGGVKASDLPSRDDDARVDSRRGSRAARALGFAAAPFARLRERRRSRRGSARRAHRGRAGARDRANL